MMKKADKLIYSQEIKRLVNYEIDCREEEKKSKRVASFISIFVSALYWTVLTVSFICVVYTYKDIPMGATSLIVLFVMVCLLMIGGIIAILLPRIVYDKVLEGK